MKSKKPIIFKVQHPVMSDNDFRQMLEGIMMHRDNFIRHGSPFPPEQPALEIIEERKRELEAQIAECKARIKELEESKERYGQLLRVIFEEESRVKEEQRAQRPNRTSGMGNVYLQPNTHV
ncbi:hypothetical protein GPJ56_006906 [Histomonas meleagridis]|uniref:uncharacterized protein n=1 Tax=Histomonas meleagridis TaxID=135588 RepID=UPI00355AB317|nr:hypothetical protein GPJ56_006906 [Histomonas meleagridis]KAH0800272.1 hypothetical protein GO595_006861 [Histomonas meleagridis]